MTRDLAVEHEQEQARLIEEAAQRERDEDDRILNTLLAAVLPAESAAYVRIRYLAATTKNPGRYVASWRGWPSDDYRTVRRVVRYDTDQQAMARDAAVAYCLWLSGGQDGYTVTPTHVTFGYVGPVEWAVLVKTHTVKR